MYIYIYIYIYNKCVVYKHIVYIYIYILIITLIIIILVLILLLLIIIIITTAYHTYCNISATAVGAVAFRATILLLFSFDSSREFRDVVFEDVGFETDTLLTLKNYKCGDFTPKADMGEGLDTSSLKPHILKHHIPEHPIKAGSYSRGWRSPSAKGVPQKLCF